MKITEDIRINVKSTEESRRVQEWAIKQGYSWPDVNYSGGNKSVQHTDMSYLYFSFFNKTILCSPEQGKEYFDSQPEKEVTFDEIFPSIPKFKVGDNVMLLGTKSSYTSWNNFCNSTRLGAGDIVRVTNARLLTKELTIKCGTNTHYTFHFDDVELVYSLPVIAYIDEKRVTHLPSINVKHLNSLSYFSISEKVKYAQDEIKVGDEVICIREGGECILPRERDLGYILSVVGKKGKIISLYDELLSNIRTGVEFYENIEGHSCNGKGKEGHCWWFNKKDLEKVNPEQTKQDEVNKMELKDCKKENLKEAKKQYEAEKKNAEIEYAKTEMARLTDYINNLDRQIRLLNKERALYIEELKLFTTK